MAEAKQYIFSYREVAELMVQQLGITDGLWGLYVKFGIAAANVGPGNEDMRPTAMVAVLELGLQKFDEPSNLTVDAAELSKGRLPKAGQRSLAKSSKLI
jgi:hypothetical protein